REVRLEVQRGHRLGGSRVQRGADLIDERTLERTADAGDEVREVADVRSSHARVMCVCLFSSYVSIFAVCSSQTACASSMQAPNVAFEDGSSGSQQPGCGTGSQGGPN